MLARDPAIRPGAKPVREALDAIVDHLLAQGVNVCLIDRAVLVAVETGVLAIGERFGFPACAILLLLYCVLICKGLQVARRTREPYGRLVCVGVITLIAVQTLLNTGMTVGLLPITGTTLPLCSYGGSSLISTYAGIGLVMNIAMRQGYEVTGEPFMFRREKIGSSTN